MVLENLLDPVFSPLLKIPDLAAITLLSFLIALIITLIYKYTTDQDLMKRLKGEMKEIQKEMKELRKDPEKAMQVNKKFMQTQKKYMLQSMRSMVFTFLPIILIFGWMQANFEFVPIMPEQEFTVSVLFDKNANGEIEISVPEGLTVEGNKKKNIENSEVKWILQGEKGEYLLEFIYDGKKETHEILISETNYKDPVKRVRNSEIKQITAELKPKKILNLFGWKLGWLGTYILFSIVFSILIRKIIKVY